MGAHPARASAEPVITYLTTTPGVHTRRFLNWLLDHDLEPDDTYKVEVFEDHLVAHQFKSGAPHLVVVAGTEPQTTTTERKLKSPCPLPPA